jgi:hypothetical protein
MWGLLKRLGSDCWGNHEWISRSNARGMWLECRHCGMESRGMELPPARYHRTQDGAEEAHRLGGMAPAQAARARAAAAPTPATALRFGTRRASPQPASPAAARAWDATTASSAVATTDAERRWLQVFRGLSPDERLIAERMVASLTLPARVVSSGEESHDERRRQDRLVG